MGYRMHAGDITPDLCPEGPTTKFEVDEGLIHIGLEQKVHIRQVAASNTAGACSKHSPWGSTDRSHYYFKTIAHN